MSPILTELHSLVDRVHSRHAQTPVGKTIDYSDLVDGAAQRIHTLLDSAETEWSKQGRTEEQRYAVRNFMTGAADALWLPKSGEKPRE